MHIYCLFCETQKCEYAALAARQLFGCKAYSPKQIQHTWDRGEMQDRIHDLLPGYVFLYFDTPVDHIWQFRRIDPMIRCLRDTDKQYELEGPDREFAEMILEKNGILGKTPVSEENGRFILQDELLREMGAKILRVDRRNTRMKLEIQLTGRKVQTWLEYEITEAQSGDSQNA